MPLNKRNTNAKRRDDWETPQDFFKGVDDVYGPLDLDVCATNSNAKCLCRITPENDGLSTPWFGRCWCNPPYSESCKWVEKALVEIRNGNARRVVLLLPVATGTKLWQDVIFPAVEEGLARIEWIRGRLKFVGAEGPATFDSALVVLEQDRRPWR